MLPKHDAANWHASEDFDSRTEKNTDKTNLMNLTNDKTNSPGWQDMIGLILEKGLLKLTDEKSSL
jgi:hypothetical protein